MSIDNIEVCHVDVQLYWRRQEHGAAFSVQDLKFPTTKLPHAVTQDEEREFARSTLAAHAHCAANAVDMFETVEVHVASWRSATLDILMEKTIDAPSSFSVDL